MNIMEYDARRQMEIKAREAFFTTVFQKRNVAPHLLLKVRRDCIIEDSLAQISSNEMDVKKGLRIEFVGEDGVDAGGLRKEWFLLLCREVFDPLYGMFAWDEETNYCWFNANSFESSDQYFLVGVVLGLAIYNSTILDIHLPLACYKKLLGVHCGLDDLRSFKPTVAKSLETLLAYEGDDFEQVFSLDFVGEKEGYGTVQQVELIPGGSKKPVTKANCHGILLISHKLMIPEYVRRYTEYILDTSISKQFEPFKRGFYHVCGGNALSLFRPEEIELLIRGSPEKLDVDQLRAVAVYEGESSRVQITEDEPVIKWFWSFFARMDFKMQRKLLSFVTGSDRIPATGVANLAFKISILGDSDSRFPIAHTCFNQLCLYRYRSRTKLEKMLIRALEESEGFGLK
jgi:HECT-domain (ubiquitin-transferase)